MDWQRALVVIERFERITQMNMREIKQLHRSIIEMQQKGCINDGNSNTISDRRHINRKLEQLLSGLRQIMNIRDQLSVGDQENFDQRIEPIRMQIQSFVNTLNLIFANTNTNSNIITNTNTNNSSNSNSSTNTTSNSRDTTTGKYYHASPSSSSSSSSSSSLSINTANNSSSTNVNIYAQLYEQQSSSLQQQQQQQQQQLVVRSEEQIRADEMRLRAEQARMDAEESKRLAAEIEDLNEIMLDLGRLVHSQHEIVDSIEENVERSKIQVESGHKHLKKAQASQSAKYPLVAAAVGSVALGGPIGLAAGSTVAGVCAALGGAIAGLYGGRLFKKKAQQAANQQ